jgi:hypothetical protein
MAAIKRSSVLRRTWSFILTFPADVERSWIVFAACSARPRSPSRTLNLVGPFSRVLDVFRFLLILRVIRNPFVKVLRDFGTLAGLRRNETREAWSRSHERTVRQQSDCANDRFRIRASNTASAEDLECHRDRAASQNGESDPQRQLGDLPDAGAARASENTPRFTEAAAIEKHYATHIRDRHRRITEWAKRRMNQLHPHSDAIYAFVFSLLCMRTGCEQLGGPKFTSSRQTRGKAWNGSLSVTPPSFLF